MATKDPKRITLIDRADRDPARKGWLTATWQLATIVLLAAAIGLSSNHLRTTGLPLIGDWSPEAQLITPSGDSLAISLADAEVMYYAHGAIFLDARSAEDYDEGHIEGALNLPWEGPPWEDLDPRIAEKLRDYSSETIFITYCDGEACGMSKELAMVMLERGYTNVRVLVNGWTLWQDRQLPVDSGLAATLTR